MRIAQKKVETQPNIKDKTGIILIRRWCFLANATDKPDLSEYVEMTDVKEKTLDDIDFLRTTVCADQPEGPKESDAVFTATPTISKNIAPYGLDNQDQWERSPRVQQFFVLLAPEPSDLTTRIRANTQTS